MRLLQASPATVRRLMNAWPPFAFTGIRITRLDPEYLGVSVRLRSYWWNKNVAGVHFGGSLFAMTDPFWMMMLLHHLGRDHVVWDRAAEIEFLKPGKGELTVRFTLDRADVGRLRKLAAGGDKVLEWFSVDVTDGSGDVVARVRKQVYVRLKRDRAVSTEGNGNE
ncbi:DUF4442 domain-containing protein [Arthrobacter sp. zg-Y1171]|uniref:DUF4442 domain-containing protein n=1 Tax=Arthrobacter sp. zg-Y1171 TaxID=2964610 RepID=UPI002102C3BC|nr:DUF4442 domain-containing protein [Arthrobacter sp. zg-Y1171]MCQ1993812.1 DUF4442 domain-containing protein [Arthrobacter sp. zg-Y1171]UWX82058.1 DUF4442 domain-containing protein [Arthrobacter sp. zg-Y1171]